jgi:hypothetical protein
MPEDDNPTFIMNDYARRTCADDCGISDAYVHRKRTSKHTIYRGNGRVVDSF